jgi:cell cycle checkpoint protein
VCKPAWFSFHTKELEASDAVGDVLGWLGKGMGVGGDMGEGASPSSVGRWTHTDVAMEFGGWLRAVDRCGGRDRSMEGEPPGGPYPEPPRSHRHFSHLLWSRGAVEGDVLGENEDWEDEEERPVPGGRCGVSEVEGKGWLEDDDIEDVD